MSAYVEAKGRRTYLEVKKEMDSLYLSRAVAFKLDTR